MTQIAHPIPLLIQPLGRSSRSLALKVVAFGMLYGLAMGSYGLGHDRILQPLISASKVPLLLMVTFILSLPSFFVINTLIGLRDDFRIATRALVQTQLAFTVILVSLAPLTLVWYASDPTYPAAVVFNGVMFFIASISAQVVLIRLYRPLIAKDRRHRAMMFLWAIIYSFVAIQMAWVLRPFIGSPGSAVRFFREGAWGNAYVEVVRLVIEMFR
ncbi:MAG TPA: hypothetical protein PK402_06980 [Tepidisphaeraceae bacterium]|nr:hypothetical protein [Tepidisphaeraceae bacterium]